MRPLRLSFASLQGYRRLKTGSLGFCFAAAALYSALIFSDLLLRISLLVVWTHWQTSRSSGMWLQNFLLQLPMALMEPTRPKQYPMGVDADCSRSVLRSEWSQHGKDYVWLGIFSIPHFHFCLFEFRVCIASAWLNCMLLFEFICACCFVNVQA